MTKENLNIVGMTKANRSIVGMTKANPSIVGMTKANLSIVGMTKTKLGTVLRFGVVTERVGANQKGVNQIDPSIRNKSLA
jgi:hypothetical protein